MRLRSALGLPLAAATLGLSVAPSGAQDAELLAFEAVAASDGVRTELDVVGAPLSSNIFDGGAPVTQATVDALGVSTAMASLPYPGETAATLPSLLFPLLGLPAPPPYPLTAASSYPAAPSAELAQGPVRLAAASEARSSVAEGTSAGDGTDGSQASIGRAHTSALARVVEDGSLVVAEARSRVESIVLAGVLRVGAVEGTATAQRPPGGALTASSTFTASGATAAGVALAVTDAGIVLPGSVAPVPDTAGLNPVLDQAGVSLAVVPAEQLDDGVVSAGLVVTFAPPGAPTSVTYTLGRTRAFVTATARRSTAAPMAVPPPASAEPATAARPAPSLPAAAVPVGAVAPAPAAPAPAAAIPAAAPGLPVSPLALGSLYLVLVLGATVAATGSVLVRRLGVRYGWKTPSSS